MKKKTCSALLVFLNYIDQVVKLRTKLIEGRLIGFSYRVIFIYYSGKI